MTTIVEETNRYARQVLGEASSTDWLDVTEKDIWAFFGFCILMGINRLPQLHLYWNTNPIYHYLPVAERITRDRFFEIWRFLHFCNNEAPPVTCASSTSSLSFVQSPSLPDPQPIDRLWKVRPVISAIVAACCANYRPHPEQAIDEAMVAFKGR